MAANAVKITEAPLSTNAEAAMGVRIAGIINPQLRALQRMVGELPDELSTLQARTPAARVELRGKLDKIQRHIEDLSTLLARGEMMGR